MTLKDKPAYPSTVKLPSHGIGLNGKITKEDMVDVHVPGMTLFESFVKAAMQGYCANPDVITKFSHLEVSRMAIAQALTQIEVLEKPYEAEKEKGNGH